MTLTAQQNDVLERFTGFLRGPERCFVLTGYAGTGKTFLIGVLARRLVDECRSFRLLAPTGRAARVLGIKTGFHASTVHRDIYNLKELVEHDHANAGFKFFFDLKTATDDNLDCVVFLDEASMVSDTYTDGEFLRFGSGRLLADLMCFLRMDDPLQRTKLVLVGDPAQLPPVGSSASLALDPTYLQQRYAVGVQQAELTEVVRQAADSPILARATAIRNTIASGICNRLCIEPSPPQIESIPADELPGRFVRQNQSLERPRAICIAYSNATCLNLNVAIRGTRLGGDGEQPLVTGDALIVIQNSALTGLLNGDIVTVADADRTPEVVFVPVGQTTVRLSFRSVRLRTEDERGNPSELSTKIVENVLHSEKRSLTPEEHKALYVHFTKRFPRLKPNSREFAEMLRVDMYFNALQVKFGYAITCHKAQGGEWDDVFVYFENARTDADSLRWAYTALTRARNRVFGVNLPAIQPWTGPREPQRTSVIDSSAPSAKNAAPFAFSESSAEAPTRWDSHFPSEPAALRQKHQRIEVEFEGAGIEIEGVDVQVSKYYWRYYLIRNGQRAQINVTFNKGGAVTPQLLPLGCNEDLGLAVLACVRKAVDAPPLLPIQMTFPINQPYLREYFEAVIAPKAAEVGATVTQIEHLQYRERYHLARAGRSTILDATYNSKGKINSLLRASGDDALAGDVLGDG